MLRGGRTDSAGGGCSHPRQGEAGEPREREGVERKRRVTSSEY